MIKLIAFDFWDTLATKRNPFFHFLDNIKEEFKLKNSKEEIREVYQNTMQVNYWESEADAFSELLKKLKIPVKKENVLKIIDIRNKADSGIIVFDFVVPLFKKLKEKGYKLAIVSNTSMFTYQYIKKKTNVLDHVDYQFFSFQIGYSKPNPQLFLEIQRRVNLYNNEILIIGDNFENDFKAPKLLGINAILFKNYDELLEEFKKYKIEL